MKFTTVQATPLELLRTLPPMRDLGEKSLVRLAAIGTVQEINAGTILFSEGEKHSRLYFICEGSIGLEMLTTKCGRQKILSVGSGDLLGWSALLGDGLMTATAIAAVDSLVVAFNAQALNQLLETDPAFGFQLMRIVAQALSRRLLATRLQLLDLYHD